MKSTLAASAIRPIPLTCSRRWFLAASFFTVATGLPDLSAASAVRLEREWQLLLHGMVERASLLREAELRALPWQVLPLPSGGMAALPLADLLQNSGLKSGARSLLAVSQGGAESLSLPLEDARAGALLLDGGFAGLALAAEGGRAFLPGLERIEIGRVLWPDRHPPSLT